MNLVNICSAELGAEILAFSSTSDEEICQASNVLEQKEDKIWTSGQGLPQYLTISLQKVAIKYDHIDTVVFYCWHDYTTNPKTIDIEVAISPEGRFTFWTQLTLKHQNGKQAFKIPEIPCTYKIIKFTITQTFGDDETYLNQIMLMATPFNSQSNSEMSVNQLEYCSYQQDHLSPQEKTGFRPRDSRKSKPRKMDIQDLKEYEQEEERNSFHSVNSQNKLRKQFEEAEQIQQNEEKESSSFDNNIAMLGLSQKMMEMEENLETVRRNIEILDLKVNISYETMEKNIMEKVEKMVDKKVKKAQEELRAELKPSRISRGVPDLREVKSQKDKLQFISSREQIEEAKEDNFQAKGKRSRDLPKSLHIQNLNQAVAKRQEGGNNSVISGLMVRLAEKLKQREMKVKKMERTKRQKYQHY